MSVRNRCLSGIDACLEYLRNPAPTNCPIPTNLLYQLNTPFTVQRTLEPLPIASSSNKPKSIQGIPYSGPSQNRYHAPRGFLIPDKVDSLDPGTGRRGLEGRNHGSQFPFLQFLIFRCLQISSDLAMEALWGGANASTLLPASLGRSQAFIRR